MIYLFTICFPNLYEYLGIEQKLMSHAFDIQYIEINPAKVMMIPTGKIAA
jgi:hypothetical protein